MSIPQTDGSGRGFTAWPFPVQKSEPKFDLVGGEGSSFRLREKRTGRLFKYVLLRGKRTLVTA